MKPPAMEQKETTSKPPEPPSLPPSNVQADQAKRQPSKEALEMAAKILANRAQRLAKPAS